MSTPGEPNLTTNQVWHLFYMTLELVLENNVIRANGKLIFYLFFFSVVYQIECSHYEFLRQLSLQKKNTVTEFQYSQFICSKMIFILYHYNLHFVSNIVQIDYEKKYQRFLRCNTLEQFKCQQIMIFKIDTYYYYGFVPQFFLKGYLLIFFEKV